MSTATVEVVVEACRSLSKLVVVAVDIPSRKLKKLAKIQIFYELVTFVNTKLLSLLSSSTVTLRTSLA